MNEHVAPMSVDDEMAPIDEDDPAVVAADMARAEKAALELQKAQASDENHTPVVTSGFRGTRSFVLYQPIKIDGRMLTKVTLRPPHGGDLDDWAAGDVPSARAMLAKLTGLHPAAIRGLDTVDLNAIYSTFWDMMPEWVREGMPNENAG